MRTTAGYLLYRMMSGLFGLLPESVMRRLGYGLGYALSFVARDRLRVAERHMRRVLGPNADVRRAARRAFAFYGRYWAEIFWVRPRRRDGVVRHTVIEGIEHLWAARDSGEGFILALPHLGNWEAAGARSAAEGVPVLAVAEALSNPKIVEWFVRLRRAMNIDIVVAQRGGSVRRRLVERLRGGGTVALLSDRDIKGSGVPVVFFGEETTIPAGPVAMADRTGTAILPVGTYFKPGRGHHFVVHPPLQLPEAPTREQRVIAGTQRLAKKLEEIIRVAPEQWHLLVPNWPSDRG
ncbi:MAG: phosphatidylinositol mannoside acyltransferase [Acidimicrobiia bacterium]